MKRVGLGRAMRSSIYLAHVLLFISLGCAGGFNVLVPTGGSGGTCQTSSSFIFLSCNDAEEYISNDGDNYYGYGDTEECRRDVLQTIAKASLLPVAAFMPDLASADDVLVSSTPIIAAKTTDTISVPLEYIPALSAYVVHYNLFGERFGAILDTGSPFLTAPATCRYVYFEQSLFYQIFSSFICCIFLTLSTLSKWSYKYKWGCYHPERTYDSGLSNTIEGFDNNQGLVVWRNAEFTFDEQLQQPKNLTFGVFGPELLDGPGGVFFGLIKHTDSWIRPSFLGQTGYSSFTVDLRQKPQLVLSKESMIDGDDYIPLVRDLNRRRKAPVVHYTAKASSFVVNGFPLYSDKKNPIYIIFDTGLSGMSVSDELWDGRNMQARKNKEKSLWGNITVSFKTTGGNEVELSAVKPITGPLGRDTPLTRLKGGNLIVLGLSFLSNTSFTVDADDDKLQLIT